MYSAKAKGDSVQVSVAAGGPPVHRRMSLDDANDFLNQLQEAIEEASE